MVESLVHVGGHHTPLRVRVNGEQATFFVDVDRVSAAALRKPDALALDLLHIACVVFATDGSIKRGGSTRPRMGEGWRRDLHFKIPVSRPDVWSAPAVTQALEDAVRTLTDDDVRFTFHKTQVMNGLQGFLPFDSTDGSRAFDEVILFSGGLDSFAGALERLATTTKRVILLSHRSAQTTIPHQQKLGAWLSKRFPGRALHLEVAARRLGEEASETTQRSRSFLFAALGQVVARTFGCGQMTFFENGIVSHNLPFSPQVVGTMATRTTHPLALHLIEALHTAALPDAVGIASPYAWFTKTEVLRRIEEHGGTSQIEEAVSCTHVRGQDAVSTHCAACTQCLDRRFAILAAGLEAHESTEIYRHDVLAGAREAERSRTLAVDWTRHAVQLPLLDVQQLLQRFGQEIIRIALGHPELEPQDVLRRTVDMHRRYGRAVQGVLEQAIVANAEGLASQSLSPTSLLVMHTGGRAPAYGTDLEDQPDASAVVPDPNAPLVIELLLVNGRRRIDVRGLTTLSGRLADVPWELSHHWREDRAAGLAPQDHRFATSADIADALARAGSKPQDYTKGWVNQLVRRTRQLLGKNFARVHGFKPDRRLLIETGSRKGYRLEPRTEVIDRTSSSDE